MNPEQVAPSLRAQLEAALRQLSDDGHLAAKGEREVRIRLTDDGRIRWFEASSVRVPASELEAA